MKKIKFRFNVKKRILPVILVSALMPMILFVAIPFEVYANNMDELLCSLSSFLPLCVLFGFLLAAGTALLLIFLPEKAYRICYALVLAFSFLFFMQGTFLNFGMNSLGGDNLGSSSTHIGLYILNAFIWIAVLAVAVALSLIRDKKGIFAIIAVILSIAVFATQVMTPVTSTIKHPDVFMRRDERIAKSGGDFVNKVLTDENLTAVASERNIFYFCIDRFDEYFAETALEVKPEIYDNLDGFTWFQDNLSMYGHTFPAVATMLTETPMDLKTQNRKSYLDSVYADNKTLSVLDENGYSVNLYTEMYYSYNTADTLPGYVDNVSVTKKTKTTRPAKLVNCMVSTAAYRCLPLFLKDLIYGVETRKFNDCVKMLGENGYYGYNSENETVYRQAAQAEFETKDGGKNFSFIHVTGCHDVTFDHISKKASNKQKRKIAASVQNGINVVNEYINVLKEKKLYKNATIIITGDHGDAIDDTSALNGPRLTALFFKRAGEDGTPVTPSPAPVSHSNVWAAIFNSEEIVRENNGDSLFDIAEKDPDQIKRKYIWHSYSGNKAVEYIYEINGVGTDFNNWELKGKNPFNRNKMN